jgi:protocatechuate 3,4-dioxygenase beta subunit
MSANPRAAWPLALLIGLGAGRSVSSQQQPPPAPEGTAVIAGTVVDEQARPVANAIVMLTGAELPTGRAAITTARGQFSFDRLPAGRFSLTASKPAYLRSAFGAVRPGGAGTPIQLTAGARLAGQTITMPHGAAIAGTIRDTKGAPVPGLSVYAMRQGVATSAPLMRAEGVTTDDRGAYRIFGLVPGAYVVAAAPIFSGGLGEVGMMTAAEVDAALARLKQRTALGPAKPQPPGTSPTSIVRPVQTFSTTPVFFPGVTSASAAAPVNVEVGQERTGVDFVYQLARAAAVSGTVSGAGESGSVQLWLSMDGGSVQVPTALGVGPILQRRSATGDGAFTFTNVTPGKYTLLARTGAPRAPTGRGEPPPANTAQPLLFAKAAVDVSGDDVSGLALALQPAPHVSGRIVPPVSTGAPTDLTKIRVRLIQAGAATSTVITPGLNPASLPVIGVVRADGTFEIEGVIPAEYRISTTGQPSAWKPKTAMYGGQDLFDTPIEITSIDIAGIEIAFSDQASQLNGRLQHADGSPASGYFVVAFPTDRSLWLPQSRRLRSVRPGTDGQFRLDDLPAGDYYLAALTDADSDDWQSPEFLAQAVAAAVKVTLAEGEKKTQDLRIGR